MHTSVARKKDACLWPTSDEWVFPGTVVRLKGDSGVCGAVVLPALRIRLGDILHVSKDNTGLMLDLDALPQRIRRPKPLVLAGKGLDEGKP